MSFIKYYTELFTGTTECYAISRDWQVDGKQRRAYIPSNYSGPKDTVQNVVKEVVDEVGSAEFDELAAKAHLTGQHFLGAYAIDKDSTVGFFALDFDKDELEARKEARRHQATFLREAGIRTYIERSRSGNGYHLWGFFEERVNAGELRFALEPYIEDSKTYDRMFPNQDGTTELRPYGNLIALPLYGPNVKEHKSVFIEIDPTNYTVTEIDNQKQYLFDVEKISKDKIQKLFAKRKEIYVPDLGGRKRVGETEGLDGLYKVIHPDVGCEWVKWALENPTEVTEPEWYTLACQFAQLNGGRDAFHDASSQDPRYDPKVTDEKFDHAMETNAPHGCKYIRENHNGPKCKCDERFPEHNIQHPYDLAKVPFYQMVEKLNLDEPPKTTAVGIPALMEHIKRVIKDPSLFQGVQYGMPGLDQFTELRPNDLVLFCARPGRGKTAFLVDIAYRIASQGVPLYIYSMEMTADQFWLRLIARAAQVDGKRLQKGTLNYSEIRRMLKVEEELSLLPIFIDDTTYDANLVVDKAAEMIELHGKGIVMIDYMQMAVSRPGESAYDKNSRIPRQYKLLAKSMNVPVFCLAQMNREGEDLTEESETTDSVIEGSGKIEQYADVILYLLGKKSPGIVRRTLVVHKERHRDPAHKVKFDFNQPVMTFEPEGFWANQAKQMTTMINSKDMF